MAVKNLIFVSILIAILSVFTVEYFRDKPKHPDAHRSIPEIIEKYEYPVEVHEIITEDGYILTLHRIPHGRIKTEQKRIPILLISGFAQTAADYVYMGPDISLGFLLVDKGFDVWLGNVRGSTYSRKHINLNPDTDPTYWNYTLHQFGVYDIPAFIDHILETTQQDWLHYVGYSQGGAFFAIMASEKPEYVNKIGLATALAPAIFLKDPQSLVIRILSKNLNIVSKIFKVLNINELFRSGSLYRIFLSYICHPNSMFLNLCQYQYILLFGNNGGIDKNHLPLAVTHIPTSVSLRHAVHLFQTIDSGELHKYDYGAKDNLKEYGQEKAPRYNLSKITTPIALYYSSNDATSNLDNIDRIVNAFPNVVKKYQVPSDTFNHLDFFLHPNVADLLYKSVIEEILKYSKLQNSKAEEE